MHRRPQHRLELPDHGELARSQEGSEGGRPQVQEQGRQLVRDRRDRAVLECVHEFIHGLGGTQPVDDLLRLLLTLRIEQPGPTLQVLQFLEHPGCGRDRTAGEKIRQERAQDGEDLALPLWVRRLLEPVQQGRQHVAPKVPVHLEFDFPA